MKILFTFPGQGGQRPGMLAMIPDREAILTQARAVLGDEVATLDSADALQHTRAVQLCLLIAVSPGRASYSVRAWIRRWSAACPSARFRPR
ncbi:malonyl CoA-acyl carrier protein transacylase [Klebsiella pneumoniae]|uniref:Malonyl CoA-acyl carrier protein transacylase n=1 Tax=Klebsiella pneumoniae TaxID=573 RepID=A0A378BBQ6_KLEPN|nr:malonyl CoA-acyl carrier protein transacylase [Klebsiella pneumoniae]